MEDLGTLGWRNARIDGINVFGDMIANVDVGPFVTHVLVIRRGRPPVDIGNLGGTDPQGGALARAISNRGEVTGLSENADGGFHAFLWTKQQGMRDLGTLSTDPLSSSIGNAVNSLGMVVGSSFASPSEGSRAFVWTSRRRMRSLPALGGTESEANGINELAQIVGVSHLAGTPVRSHATLWRPAVRSEIDPD